MAYTHMTQLGEYLIDVKPQPLRDSNEWTTHFAIYHDTRDAVEPIRNIHMGNKCKNETEAYEVGLVEAKRMVGDL